MVPSMVLTCTRSSTCVHDFVHPCPNPAESSLNRLAPSQRQTAVWSQKAQEMSEETKSKPAIRHEDDMAELLAGGSTPTVANP